MNAAVYERGRDSRPIFLAGGSVLSWLARRVAAVRARLSCGSERGQSAIEYGGLLVLVAAIITTVASLNLPGQLTRAISCEIKQITSGGCTLAAAQVPSALGQPTPSAARGSARGESAMEQVVGSKRLILACAGNGQTEEGANLATQSQACKQALAKLSPRAISTLELLAAVFQAQHDYRPGSGPPCTDAQAAALVQTCAATRQQFFRTLLTGFVTCPGCAVVALSREAQQLISGPILRNEKIESTHGDVLDGFLGSLCGGYGICLGGTVDSQAYQQAYHTSAQIGKVTSTVMYATGVAGALKDVATAGLRTALIRLGVSSNDAEQTEQAVQELEKGGNQIGSIPTGRTGEQNTGASKSGRGGVGPVLKGQAGVQRAIGELKAEGYTVPGTEVTIQTPVGRTRVDIVARDPNGNVIFEVKNGPTARENPNQQRVFEYIRQHGGTPVGDNAKRAGLPVGKQMPATPVRVIKYGG